jgi:hypothetical protein
VRRLRGKVEMISELQLEFQARNVGKSQNERLADFLKSNPDRWIPMPELAKVITPTGIGVAVHSRVNDCRKKYGMTIEHRNERKAGTTASYYKYVPNAASN